MGPQKKKKQKKKKTWKRKKQNKKKVKTLNPPKCMCCLAIVCSKSVIRKKLRLWHNHCFLCCIDSKMFKWKKKKKKKKTLEKKVLFLYKGNFIPCLCTVLSPFLLWAVIYVVEKAYSTRRFSDWKFFKKRWEELVGFGTLVTVSPLLCHFQPVAAKDGNVFFHFIFVYF